MNTEKKALLSVSYPYESVSKNQCSTEKNELELYFLILDCLSIHGAIIVYDHICNLNKDSQFILYYNTLEEALIYRIMMGLSKLFENSGKARTCMRVINAIEQKQQFKLNKIIGEAISRIHIIVKQFQETYNLFPIKTQDVQTIYNHAKSSVEEAEWIAETIVKLNKVGVELNSFAILYRAHYVSRPIEESLMKL